MNTDINLTNIIIPDSNANHMLICEIIYQIFIDSAFLEDIENMHDVKFVNYTSALPEL